MPPGCPSDSLLFSDINILYTHTAFPALLPTFPNTHQPSQDTKCISLLMPAIKDFTIKAGVGGDDWSICAVIPTQSYPSFKVVWFPILAPEELGSLLGSSAPKSPSGVPEPTWTKAPGQLSPGGQHRPVQDGFVTRQSCPWAPSPAQEGGTVALVPTPAPENWGSNPTAYSFPCKACQ